MTLIIRETMHKAELDYRLLTFAFKMQTFAGDKISHSNKISYQCFAKSSSRWSHRVKLISTNLNPICHQHSIALVPTHYKAQILYCYYIAFDDIRTDFVNYIGPN